MRSNEGIFNEIKGKYASKHGAKVAFIRKKAAEYRKGQSLDMMSQRDAMIKAHRDWDNLPYEVFMKTGQKKDFMQLMVEIRQLEFNESLTFSATKATEAWKDIEQHIEEFIEE